MQSFLLKSAFPLFCAVLLAASDALAQETGRERWSLDNDWSFARGKAGDIGRRIYLRKGYAGFKAFEDFKDLKVSKVRLPHDWAVDLPRDKTAQGVQAFKPLGFEFPENSIGWYWRGLDIPASKAGRRVWVEFDGVYRDAKIWFNGYYLGGHEPRSRPVPHPHQARFRRAAGITGASRSNHTQAVR